MSAPSAATIQNKLGCSASLAKSIRFALLGEPGSEAQIVRTLKEVNFLIGGRGVREVLSESRKDVLIWFVDSGGHNAPTILWRNDIGAFQASSYTDALVSMARKGHRAY